MGSPVTNEGWMLNGKTYGHNRPVNYDPQVEPMVYYVSNECGTTFSDSSLYVSCSGDPSNTQDSLAIAGSEKNLQLWRNDEWVTDDHLNVEIHARYNPANLLLTTYPQDKARVYMDDDAQLTLHTNYHPLYYYWYKVRGEYDATDPASLLSDGTVDPDYRSAGDEDDELLATTDSATHEPYRMTLSALEDSASYYVLISDSVCPSVTSNLVSIDVMKQIPTAITPYTRDGINDVFMKGHHVIIFNRYGQQVFEGSDGWDGTYRGVLADPGVYYYDLNMKKTSLKGSIEVVKFDK